MWLNPYMSKSSVYPERQKKLKSLIAMEPNQIIQVAEWNQVIEKTEVTHLHKLRQERGRAMRPLH